MTKIKYLKSICIPFENEENFSEDGYSVSVYECLGCHWRFIGDADRYDYGYDTESTEIPNFCPMCGKEIDEYID